MKHAVLSSANGNTLKESIHYLKSSNEELQSTQHNLMRIMFDI
jgi:hypothetical protein